MQAVFKITRNYQHIDYIEAATAEDAERKGWELAPVEGDDRFVCESVEVEWMNA